MITQSEQTLDADGDGGEPDARYAFNAGEDSKHHVGPLRGSLEDDPSEEARNFRFETDRQPGDNGGDRPRRIKLDPYDDGEWDPDSLLALGKKKSPSSTVKDVESDVKPNEEEVVAPSHDRIKGEAVKWQVAGINESKSAAGKTREVGAIEGDVKQEELGPEPHAHEVKKEEVAPESKPAAGSMFKKRKAPGAANRSVRQKM